MEANRGSSKEKRSDCPLLSRLPAPAGVLVIMDAGIASEENLQWLITNNYHHLVVSRERKRDIAMEQTRVIESAGCDQIHLQRQPGEHPLLVKGSASCSLVGGGSEKVDGSWTPRS